MMQEEFLHYIWQYQLFNHSSLKTTDGELISVLNPGFLNTHSGPDFSDAKIRIGDNIWIGNVEIHKKSSDWFSHNHHFDNAYKSVILHVVYTSDFSKVENVPELSLLGRIDLHRHLQWKKLVNHPDWIPCLNSIGDVPDIIKLQAIERLSVERLQRKTDEVYKLHVRYNGNWEKTLLIMISRSLGAKVNSPPFQVLAELIPLNNIKKLKGKLLSIEALIFGLSGLLKPQKGDAYVEKLVHEYDFLKRKYSLDEMNSTHWKFMRMRPANFPSLRIAQFSLILNNWDKLIEQLFYNSSVENLTSILQQPMNIYWKSHYRFGKTAKVKSSKLGSTMVNLILINSIVPFLYTYGKAHDDASLQESAIETLQQIKSENNSIISRWKSIGIENRSAFESQGLIELKNEYCTFKKCLTCKIGVWILNRE